MLHRLPTAVTSTTLTHTVDHSEDVGHLTMKIPADADLQFVLRACNTSGAVHRQRCLRSGITGVAVRCPVPQGAVAKVCGLQFDLCNLRFSFQFSSLFHGICVVHYCVLADLVLLCVCSAVHRWGGLAGGHVWFLLLPRIQFSTTSRSASVVWAAHAAHGAVLVQLVGMRFCIAGVQLTSVRLAVPLALATICCSCASLGSYRRSGYVDRFHFFNGSLMQE